jgi:hypothetical protein
MDSLETHLKLCHQTDLLHLNYMTGLDTQTPEGLQEAVIQLLSTIDAIIL